MIKAFKDAFRTPLQTHLDPTPNPPGLHSKSTWTQIQNHMISGLRLLASTTMW
jgi:hypothetical protein